MSARRVRILILSAVAFVVLLCTMCFTVTFAKWDVGSMTNTATATGSVGQFYVEYPRYDENNISYESSNVYLRGQLDDDTAENHHWETNAEKYRFYECVVTDPNYTHQYEFVKHFKTTEPFQVFETNKGNYQNFYKAEYKGAIGGKWDNKTVPVDGTYRIVLRRQDTIAAESTAEFEILVGLIKADNDNTGNTTPTPTEPTTVAPTRDTSKRSVKVNFSGDNSAIVFEAINHDWSGAGDVRFHIWVEGGVGTVWDNRLYMDKAADKVGQNVTTLACKSTDITGIIIDCESGRTGGGADFFNEKFPSGLQPNYKYTFNIEKLHDYKEANSSFANITVTSTAPTTSSGSSGSSGGSSSGDISQTITVEAGTPLSGALYKDEIVRNVSGSTAPDSTVYKYHNYIAVKRNNSASTINDNSCCYLDFTIANNGGASLDTVFVREIKLTRYEANADGTLTGTEVTPAPTLRNYDSMNTSFTLADINHIVSTYSGSNENLNSSYYENGIYAVLFFADGGEQYQALDIEITTYQEASFTLTVNASNVNHWERYKDGCGEPFGFYMGGTINGVSLWEPQFTTRITTNSGAIDINDPTSFKWIRFDEDTKEITYPTNDTADKINTVRYPTKQLDLTFTAALGAGSSIKPYMLSVDGNRMDGKKTLYLVPNNIVCDDALYGSGNKFDKDLNVLIPKSGIYSIRFVGTLHTREDTVGGKSGQYINLKSGAREPSLNSGNVYINNFNMLIDTMYITYAESETDENAYHSVTFYKGEGTFVAGDRDSITRRVAHYMLATAPEITPPSGKTLVGWYTTDDFSGDAFDFSTAVTANLELWPKFAEAYTITFWHNDGTGDKTEKVTDLSGNIDQVPTVSRTDGYSFVGWYTAATGGNKVDPVPTSGYTSDTEYYAHWEEAVDYTVTLYYNYDGADNEGVYQTSTGKTSPATKPTPDKTMTGHSFSGKWYTDADCTNEYTSWGSDLTADLDLYAGWTGSSYGVNGVMKTLTGMNAYYDANAITSSVTIKVYYNGKALSAIDDGTCGRVTLNASAKTFTIAANATTKGKFIVSATSTKAGFKFVGGTAVGTSDSSITTGSSTNQGYYVVGTFSNGKVYAANKMEHDSGFVGVWHKSLSFAIAGSDKYEIWQVPASGAAKIVKSSEANRAVTSTDFYYDQYNVEAYAYSSGHDSNFTYQPYPTKEYIDTHVRFIYDTQNKISGTSLDTFYIHYWNASNNTITTSWPGVRLARLGSTSTYYLHDAQLESNNSTSSIGKLIIHNNTGDNGFKSNDSPCTTTYGKTYKITGSTSDLTAWNKWTASVSVMTSW